ncbi:hypothetical protein BJ878DRAFT_568741 [Calycina marina]|uniref:Uncharacterized protein n=1 Tax=Calycina marina TaxID=1763456 RepID=A0A9P7Z0J2_9HELO|nr:hypothetical protein BJ878DRAFT_568741 [Calycina marina]
MADPGGVYAEEISDDTSADIEMAGEDTIAQVKTPAATTTPDDRYNLPFQDDTVEDAPARVTYIDFLKSPVIGLLVGQDACAKFSDDVSERRIDLIEADLDAISGSHNFERDTHTLTVDETGDQLPKHARVYTLGENLQLPVLKALASSKIHLVNSTARGEIAYARYIYAHTAKNDDSIRAPVAKFWATRSHTLRSEAEDEFRSMCLKFPQFGYDVLTLVLDEKLKRERNEKTHPTPASSRKRPRGI